MIPSNWAKADSTTIQRFYEAGLVFSVHYNGSEYVGRVVDVTMTLPPLTVPLTAKSFWTAALSMNAIGASAWRAYAMESIQ